jgi:hypothetical protein
MWKNSWPEPPFANAPESRNGTVIKRVLASVPLVSESAGLAHVLQAIQVIRHVTDKKTGEVKTGSRIFVSSHAWAPGRAASLGMGRMARRHWVVENNIHWARDGVWKEDSCRCRCPNVACALALLRTALLAPVRASGRPSLTTALESFAENKTSAVSLIRNQRLA